MAAARRSNPPVRLIQAVMHLASSSNRQVSDRRTENCLQAFGFDDWCKVWGVLRTLRGTANLRVPDIIRHAGALCRRAESLVPHFRERAKPPTSVGDSFQA